MELESGATAASEESESPPRSQASQASAALQADYARLIRNQSLQSQLGLTKSGIDLLEQMVVGDEESARAAQQVLESLVGQSDHDQRSQVDVSANQISLWNDSAQTMVMDACDFPLDHTPDAIGASEHFEITTPFQVPNVAHLLNSITLDSLANGNDITLDPNSIPLAPQFALRMVIQGVPCRLMINVASISAEEDDMTWRFLQVAQGINYSNIDTDRLITHEDLPTRTNRSELATTSDAVGSQRLRSRSPCH